ncbi:MAG: GAF domain-containing protein, partial [Anaerolineae bacterium]
MSKARILIAEDEAVIALDMKETLERKGYAVPAVVASTHDALKETAHLKPDLVLLDIGLKGDLSGVDVAERITAEFQIPVVCLTGHAGEATAGREGGTRRSSYLVKPPEDRELELSVEMALYRYATEGELRVREQWISATLGSISDAVVTTDGDGSVTFLNPSAQQLTGWQLSDAAGRHWTEVLALADAETRTAIGLSLAEAADTGGPKRLGDCIVTARDGVETCVDGSVQRIGDGTVTERLGYVLSFRRIEERLLAERALRASEERLAVLNAVSSAVFSSLEPDTVMQQILSATRQAFRAPRGSIMIRDRESGELVFTMTSSGEQGDKLRLKGVRLEPGQGIASWVVEHDQSALVEDVRTDPRWFGGVDEISGFGTRSLMGAPLKRRGEIIGVIEILSDRQDAFSTEDLNLLEALCAIAAVGLDNSRLYAAMRSQADALARLHQVGQALSSTLDYDGVIHSGLRRIHDFFPASNVWFLEPRPGSGELRLVASVANRRVTDVLIRQEPGDAFTTRLLEEGKPQLLLEAAADNPFLVGVDEHVGTPTRSLVAVPLATTDRITGAVGVSGSERDAFDRGDLNMLQAIASTMSVALENARLYEDLKALLREREDTEARLIQSEKMAALGRLVATITHEVNNPLQAIQGCLSLAEEEMDGRRREEKLRRYLQVASTEIGDIADIIGRARAFYRPDAESPRPTDVRAVLESVLSLSSRQLQRGDVVVECKWAADLPLILASPGQLRQVFLNLVLNAVDAMPEGGTLGVRT